MTAPKSGLRFLRDGVAEYFKENSVPAVVAPVGLRQRSFQLNASPGGGNRVVFIPGEFDGDLAPRVRRYGALSRETRNRGSVVNPRELLEWDRPFTLSVWSAPVPGRAEDDGLALEVAEDLLEQVVRAVNYVVAADVAWGDVAITSPPQEGAFGVELLVGATIHGPLYDVELEVVTPATGTLTKVVA